ncbi:MULTISPECIES: siroheme synthase CysG [unclassified Azospirillum]|uniref:siroheme synthase CysG n=1 Tax=unclassified Azospirillum TaxID=2630922 RepID=UPI000B66DE11|nr:MULTISPECIES: siroheme synthase CysG [unclassified Azospirillum]SNS18141.1 uroporphyrinogen-III C-methyltransferase [Azospirillum sp. RU38E]SNS35618.1 uroporphyrinogen-III C-methyltransferase [Azospirillum sp. RU37A]
MLHPSLPPEGPMPYFPVFMDLRGRRVLLAGGGDAAAAKARLLHRAGADILLLAARLEPEMAELLHAQSIARWESDFRPGLLDGVVLAIDGAGDPDLTDRIRSAAFSRNVPVNVVDVPEQCDFIVPAILDRAPVVVAVSTGGDAPALARIIRQRLESAIPAGIGRLARAAARCRSQVRAQLSGTRARQRFWDRMLGGEQADRLMQMGEDAAAAYILAELEKHDAAGQGEGGAVALVGAGPGDPGLLTLHAARAIETADIILHDALVSPAILSLARRECRLVPVGKRAGLPSVAQGFTNRMLAAFARRGLRVVRLKGGDPFIFGRGGEEAAYLREQGIAVRIIPGITAAAGAAAMLGLPLTHRGVARSLRLVTAQCQSRADTDAIDWASMADPTTTLAIYMGRDRAGDIAHALMKAGLPPQTPAALIANACRADASHHFAPVSQMEAAAMAVPAEAPALILIGDAVAQAPGWAAAMLTALSQPHNQPSRLNHR